MKINPRKSQKRKRLRKAATVKRRNLKKPNDYQVLRIQAQQYLIVR